MDIKTKFDIGNKVWFIANNKVQKLEVTGISISADLGIDPKIEYTLHFDYNIDENEVFSSKEELLKSL